MYTDNPNRPHNYNEKSFYNETGLKLMNLLESKWFKKTERYNDILCIFWFSNICDYYRILEDENNIYLTSYELQQFNKIEWCIVVKEHKYKNLIKSTYPRKYLNKNIIWKHRILNIQGTVIEKLTPKCVIWPRFDLYNLEIFKRWNEHKYWYLATPNT